MKKIISIFFSISLLPTVSSGQTIVVDSIETHKVMIVDSVTIRNIGVTHSGSLLVKGLSDINISGVFEVKLGGEFRTEHLDNYPFFFIYDNSGNRIRRESE